MNCCNAWHLGLLHWVNDEGAICTFYIDVQSAVLCAPYYSSTSLPFGLYTGQQMSSCMAFLVSVLPDYLTY